MAEKETNLINISKSTFDFYSTNKLFPPYNLNYGDIFCNYVR